MKRPIRIEGDVAYVTLTKCYVAVIDAADVPLVEGFNWSAMVKVRPDGLVKTVYAYRADYSGEKQRAVYLHRTIMGEPEGFDVDHRDRDGLNNRRDNLRSATPAQNNQNRGKSANNTSGYKGVAWHKRESKWHVSIAKDRKRHYLGLFNCPTAAHFAYVKASRELHGEFGRVA